MKAKVRDMVEHKYFIIIGKKNNRQILNRLSFNSRRDAESHIRATLRANSDAQRKQVGFINPRVRLVPIWSNGDPQQRRF